MRARDLLICLLGPLLLAITCSGYEPCNNFLGHRGLTKRCVSSYCCGSSNYRYCCRDCNLRYPRVYCSTDQHPQTNPESMNLTSMQITWLVVGFILLLKGIIAVIYLCCCRNLNRRANRSRSNDQDTECGPSPSHIPYDPSGPGAPPSYEDLVKDGILNPAYDRETCARSDAAADSVPAPPAVPASGMPAPPPYCAVVPQTEPEDASASASASEPAPAPAAADSGSQMPR